MEAYSERYEAALAMAARTHRDQTRKASDVPYIVHLAHVSVILIRHGFGEDLAIAGLLHDAVEDQDLPLVEVEAADTLHTVRSLLAGLAEHGPAHWSRFSRGPDQSLWFYESVAEIVRERLAAHPLADELDRAVDALEEAIAAGEDR